MNLIEEYGRLDSIGVERHDRGFLVFTGAVDHGGHGQGFGGIVLDNPPVGDSFGPRTTTREDATAVGLIYLFCGMDFAKCKNLAIIALRTEPRGKIVGLKWPPFNQFNRDQVLMFEDLYPKRD